MARGLVKANFTTLVKFPNGGGDGGGGTIRFLASRRLDDPL